MVLASILMAATAATGSAISFEEAVEITVLEFKQINRSERFDAIEIYIEAIDAYYAANDMPGRMQCMRELRSRTIGGSSELVRLILDQLDIALNSARVSDLAITVVELNCSD